MLEAVQDKTRLSDEEFRAEFRNWLEMNYPDEWKRPIVLRICGDDEKRWLGMLYDGGWRLPSWPREFGGMGVALSKQLIYKDELERIGAARYLDSGGVLLGPALMKYGSAEQQAQILPGIVRGEVLWCQGYSEPNSGSDLASLKTSAVRDGDDYVINGTKIWTTMVMDSQAIFLLARTSSDGRKQEGISFFVFDLDLPGISIRPIENLAGDTEFGQVFFDNVRVPATSIVHEEGMGWTVAKSLLGDERIMSGSPAMPRMAFDIFQRVVRELGLADSASTRVLYSELLCDINDHTALFEQVADAAIRGEADNTAFSLLKILATELFQKVSDATLTIAGDHAGLWDETKIGGLTEELRRVFMIARPSSIYGGANEVQRDIIARSLLGKAGS